MHVCICNTEHTGVEDHQYNKTIIPSIAGLPNLMTAKVTHYNCILDMILISSPCQWMAIVQLEREPAHG